MKKAFAVFLLKLLFLPLILDFKSNKNTKSEELYYENQPVAQGYSGGEITSDFDLSKFGIDKKSLLNIINSVV